VRAPAQFNKHTVRRDKRGAFTWVPLATTLTASSKHRLPPSTLDLTTANLEVYLNAETGVESRASATETNPSLQADAGLVVLVAAVAERWIYLFLWFRVGAPRTRRVFEVEVGRGRASQWRLSREEEDNGGDAGIRSRESRRRSLRPCHLPPAATDHSPHSVLAFWSFMWFVGFCFLANQWQVSKEEDNPLREGGDAARAAITFSFFSIFTWVAQTLFSIEKFKNVSFEEEYTKLFPPQPHQPLV
uniref:Synaptogyrin 1 n=1 Tax=Oryzias latipes TaxID=8090 RepID=A0A3P9HFG8_ORYLA